MATIRKRRGKYQVIIRRKDHPHLSKCFVSKEAAKEWARDTEVNIERGLYANLNQAMSMKLSTLLQSYREHVTPGKKGHKEESYKIAKLIRYDICKNSLAKLTVMKIKSLFGSFPARPTAFLKASPSESILLQILLASSKVSIIT